MFPPSVAQAVVGLKTTFSAHHLAECMGFLGVVSVFIEIGSRKEILLAFLMGGLVDLSY